MAELERIYTVNLTKAYEYIRTRRARRTVKLLRAFIARHMKADEEQVRISNMTNSEIFSHGMEKPPRRMRIQAIKDAGLVNVYLVGEQEKIATSLKAIEAKTKAREIARKAAADKKKAAGDVKKAEKKEAPAAAQKAAAPSTASAAKPATTSAPAKGAQMPPEAKK
jgi:large subunit ribosomal protein L31e